MGFLFEKAGGITNNGFGESILEMTVKGYE
jgi:hypothetical protein